MIAVHDPFVGGIQTAADRMLRINQLDVADVQIVLARTDLQASVRKHAEKRLRRLQAMQRQNNRPWGSTP